MKLIMLLPLAFFPLVACAPRISESSTTAPQMEKLYRLDHYKKKYPDAVAKVSDMLEKEGEKAAHFYAQIEQVNREGILIFQLWHQDGWLAKKSKNEVIVGNPSGRCRTIHYNTKTQLASDSMIWQ